MITTIGATVKGGTSVNYKTGDWREFRPIFVNRIAPCREACPAGINIQRFLWEARHQRFEQAWKIIMEENPLPSICGRVCGHPCENACNRKEFDEPIAIHAVETFVGDYGLTNRLNLPMSGPKLKKRVAVIGSGPAGLSCAYHLMCLGYESVIFERSAKAGGMLRWGIPNYRLPETILNQEIEKLQKQGIKIETSASLGKDFLDRGRKEFEAIFLAIGSQKNRKMGIPGEDLPEVQSRLLELKNLFKSSGVRAHFISGITRQGVPELMSAIAEMLDSDLSGTVKWWHRNEPHKPWSIGLILPNGAQYFPDFVVKVNGRTFGDGLLLVETKGDHLLNSSDTQDKVLASHQCYKRPLMLMREDSGRFMTVRQDANGKNAPDQVFRLDLMVSY